MNRKGKINGSFARFVIVSIIVIVIIVALLGYFYYKHYYPKQVTRDNLKNNQLYSFTAVKAENEYYNEETGYVYVSLINDKNEVMDICTNKEQKYIDLMSASKDNPVEFVGTSYEQDFDYREALMNYFEYSDVTYIHVFGLEDYKLVLGIEDYIVLAAALIILIALIYSIFSGIKLKKKAMEFFDNNSLYNDVPATIQAHKYVDIVKDYIIVMTAKPFIINIRDASEFVLTRHRSYFITTHFTLTFREKDGKKRSVALPKLKKGKDNELIDYINKMHNKVVNNVNSL
ncbi:MAG: hypothetical protein CSB16_01890 [Clostridiales bacterium]|nr:MAG: hypothetical protein CSB16_01890 [Clostridiales bacterium]